MDKLIYSLYRNGYNIITALTNIFAILPYAVASYHGDDTTCTFIALAAISSSISHLFMSHKHGLAGFGTDIMSSMFLDLIDVICAILLVTRIGYIIYPHRLQLKNEYFFFTSVYLAFIWHMFLTTSESNKSLSTRKRYVICHNIWHVGIFTTLWYFLSNYYLTV